MFSVSRMCLMTFTARADSWPSRYFSGDSTMALNHLKESLGDLSAPMTVSICSCGIFCLDKISRISPSRVSNFSARVLTISTMSWLSAWILSLSCSIIFRKAVSSS
ncbi:hypothetical protein OMAG_001713 [Candidatus Omnitrophus magneticus]|uniref:Uncharacterized protein n=2 Tax=Candidatus Omnitrophus magneticus TaxID=1609969 RepID=A0A0F0CMD8_9BACT|nr:hypothetical protein OMAG_001713 [Candidatus Omnitrophus magneticus]